MYTFAPFCTYAAAIMVPIPDPPPVTTAAKNALRKSESPTYTGVAEELLLLTDFALHIEQRGNSEILSPTGQHCVLRSSRFV